MIFILIFLLCFLFIYIPCAMVAAHMRLCHRQRMQDEYERAQLADAQLVARVAAEPKSGVSALDLARAKQILERENAIQKSGWFGKVARNWNR